MNIMSSDGNGPGVSAADPSDPSAPAPKKVTIKRRTKTGCATCRKRRIKCDEGKPRCNNCIKSKRSCEGYNQRVVFKDPLGTFQPHHHIGSILYQHNGAAPPMLVNPHIAAAARAASAPMPGSLPFIAPRPSMPGDAALPPNDSYALPSHPHLHSGMHSHMQQHLPQHLHPGQQIPLHEQLQLIPPEQLLTPDSLDFHTPYPPLTQTDISFDQAQFFAQPWPQQPLPQQEHHQHPYPQATGPPYAHGSEPSSEDVLPHAFATSVAAVPDASQDTFTEWLPNTTYANGDSSSAPPQEDRQQPAPRVTYAPTERRGRYEVFQEVDAYWYSDDDASMADSEDDAIVDNDVARHLESNDLGTIVVGHLRKRPLDDYGTQLRTFQNFADASVLTSYIPSSTNSPLNDAQTAAVFWYFVNVTGPSISLFERRPLDPSHMFDGQPVPKSRQHIWTYTFPVIALSHPALLQAILALASLQMAKLQGTPATASMKHYHLSLRRVARNYQSSSRRVQPATLAATLLLSFYEVWNSDHDKWCKHMWGARAIFREIPLRSMTRKIMALKRAHRQQWEAQKANRREANTYVEETGLGRDIDQVDPKFVSQVSGTPVSYEDTGDEEPDYGRFRHSSASNPTWSAPDHYTEKDVETFELITDIFWWYCKMDIYQSILGGTPLLMEYKHWTQAAPRAPFAKIDSLYGTYDHLVLLLGRMCQFSARDQIRKRKVKQAPPGPGGQARSPPGFAGMVPATGRIQIPNGFTPPSGEETSPLPENQEEPDLEASTAAALREWDEIRKAFEVFRQMLGPDFEPLGPTYEPLVHCPFGTALKYRSYGVAAVWMNYYMGLIVLHRAHPSMPPFAMVAAGMAAQKTAPYANEIGRIIAGLTVEDLSTLPHVSTVVGASCIESCFPLFVAAVQYQDLAQRHWTVRYLRNVVRLTGWQSADQIAYGCEIGWGKAADMGRGPPYQPLVDDGPPRHLRRIQDRIREITEEEGGAMQTGTAALDQFERPHYAVGLLTMEAEFNTLNLGDDA